MALFREASSRKREPDMITTAENWILKPFCQAHFPRGGWVKQLYSLSEPYFALEIERAAVEADSLMR
jgi:hypothetical protein